MAGWPLKLKVGLVLALLGVAATFAVLAADRGRCTPGRLDGPGSLRGAALAAITAHADAPIGSHAMGILPDNPVDRTQVELLSLCASVRGDTARATASAEVRGIDAGGELVTASIEEYRLRLERDGTKWRVTELRNPSEFDPDG